MDCTKKMWSFKGLRERGAEIDDVERAHVPEPACYSQVPSIRWVNTLGVCRRPQATNNNVKDLYYRVFYQ